jgi:ubiquinol-cytochrome c reductase iron-sulfur subunit
MSGERGGRAARAATRFAVRLGAIVATVRALRRALSRRDRERGPDEEDPGAVALVAILCATSATASVGFVVVVLAGGQTQAEGGLLALALGTLGASLVVWSRRLSGPGETEPESLREARPTPPEPKERAAFARDLAHGLEPLRRRRFLGLAAGSAVAALALAVVAPLRWLGPAPGDALRRTAWRAGLRAVRADGSPVRADEVELGASVTVFPEGSEGAADAQTVLVRVRPGELRPPAREGWAPDGLVGYSQLCTHAACAVGLYEERSRRLVCPCHNSAFDLRRGAEPVVGPAARRLPQLPLEVDGEGFVRARGDFPEPVGPGFWDA